MKKKRLYGDKVDIKKDSVKNFWDKRAEKYTEDNPYKVVKCNDNNSEYMKILDEYEKNIIIPKLRIDKNSKVLDIGCGIGRLSENIIDISNYYLGTDISNELLNIAKKRINLKGNYNFEVCDFINIDKNNRVNENKLFNKVILAGVAMYINDEELEEGFKGLIDLLDEKSTIYISCPISIEERLTLREFYSESLKSEYSAIYRTVDEYMNILKIFINNGFEITEQSVFLQEIKQYKETERYYFILNRK